MRNLLTMLVVYFALVMPITALSQGHDVKYLMSDADDVIFSGWHYANGIVCSSNESAHTLINKRARLGAQDWSDYVYRLVLSQDACVLRNVHVTIYRPLEAWLDNHDEWVIFESDVEIPVEVDRTPPPINVYLLLPRLE